MAEADEALSPEGVTGATIDTRGDDDAKYLFPEELSVEGNQTCRYMV